MKNLWKRFADSDEGATAIEYALIAAFISMTIIVSATNLGTELNSIFGDVETGLQARG